jgi:hypothetical protein
MLGSEVRIQDRSRFFHRLPTFEAARAALQVITCPVASFLLGGPQAFLASLVVFLQLPSLYLSLKMDWDLYSSEDDIPLFQSLPSIPPQVGNIT